MHSRFLPQPIPLSKSDKGRQGCWNMTSPMCRRKGTWGRMAVVYIHISRVAPHSFTTATRATILSRASPTPRILQRLAANLSTGHRNNCQASAYVNRKKGLQLVSQAYTPWSVRAPSLCGLVHPPQCAPPVPSVTPCRQDR